jgi:hypothetical protein
VTVSVLDDDRAGILVLPTSLTIGEPAGTAPFTIRLTSQPTADVTVDLSTSNSQCTASPDPVVVTSSNWSGGVQVTVGAVNDAIADGTQTCVVQTAQATSADSNYRINPNDVTVTVEDDDVAGVAFSSIDLTVSEPDGCDVFTATLTSQPIAPVTIGLSTSNNECSIAPDLLSLDEANWASGVPLTACAVDDPYLDGARPCLVRVEAITSSDPLYDDMQTGSLTVTVTVQNDDTVARIYLPLLAANWPLGVWEIEPNDDALSQANGPIASGVTYHGRFPNENDPKDYFYLDLQTAHTVELWLTNIPVGQNYDLVLRNSALASVGYSAELGNANEHILTGVLQPGHYYVQIHPNKPYGSTQAYRLTALYQ